MKTFLFIVLISFTICSYAQWVNVTNEIPAGEEPSYILAFDDVIFCTTNHLIYSYSNLYYSLNNGDSWNFRSGNAAVISYKNRFYGCYGDSIWLSLDSGLTFQKLVVENRGIINKTTTKSFSSSNNANHLILYYDTLVMISLNYYYKSFDDGWTWYKYPISTYNYDGLVLANDTNIFFRINEPDKGCIKYFDNNGQLRYLFKNPDWSNNYINDAMFLDSLLFICCNQLLVYHNGVTSVAISGCGNYCAKSIVSYGDTIFVAFNNTVYKAHKSDYLNWTSDGLTVTGSYNYIKELFVHKNYLFALSTYDVYRKELIPLSNEQYKTDNSNDVIFFPNPATDFLDVNIPYTKLPAYMTIYDIYGEIIKEIRLMSGKESLNIGNLPKGIYIIKLKCKSGIIFSKFLKV
jgi:hypothetical protein